MTGRALELFEAPGSLLLFSEDCLEFELTRTIDWPWDDFVDEFANDELRCY